MEYHKLVENTRATFNTGRTWDVNFRKLQLKRFLQMLEENEAALIKALYEDMRKPRHEACLAEIGSVKNEILHILYRVDEWLKIEKPIKPIAAAFEELFIYPEPYGVVLVIGAWNYPIMSLLQPMSGAIAAGNCVIAKPSEISSTTAQLLQKIMPLYLDQECYKVVCGGVPETTELLKEKFDYIFFTGSNRVGKLVREAANKNLTPTTLELGGKCPIYIDGSVNMDVAIKRILWSRFLNLGQVCVAPDYILCQKEIQEEFVARAKQILKEWYGEDPQKSPDLARIINDYHFERLLSYLKDGEIAVGGKHDRKDRWIEPTILLNVSPDSKVMKEEIFGPILPILEVDNADNAIQFIKERNEPLVTYLFTTNSELVNKFLKHIRTGSLTVNDCVIQVGVLELPFGGFGQSGMGTYHGKASFDCFTHRKSCLIRTFGKVADFATKKRYPPYTDENVNFISMCIKERKYLSLRVIYCGISFFIGIIAALIFFILLRD